MSNPLTPGEQIVRDFIQSGWGNIYDRLVELASSAPEELEKLLRAALVELPHDVVFSTVVGAALDLLEPNAFPGLVAEALDVLQNDRENRVAIDIVEATALQFPSVLLPYLLVLKERMAKLLRSR